MAVGIDIASLQDERIDDVVALSELVFHQSLDEAERERRRRLLQTARGFAAHDGDAIVGFTGAYAFGLSIPGGELPCAGVTFVGVAPTHRRRGLLTGLMHAAMADAVQQGQPLAALWAAESAIYGRYGFGAAVRATDFELRANRPLTFRLEPDDRPVRFVDWRDAAGELGPIHERWRARRPGMPSRTPDWWRHGVLRPDGDPQSGPTGAVRVAMIEDAGYVAYRAGDHEIRVIELVGDTPDVEAALWRWVASVDLIDRVSAPNRPLDDPLPRMLVDGDDAAASGETFDSLWLRLLDVPAALAARSWAAPVDVVLEVDDASLPANADRWRLRAAPGTEATCERTADAADVRLDVRELGAVYLGGTTVAMLAAAGLVDERTRGAVDLLDAALRVPLAPCCPEIF